MTSADIIEEVEKTIGYHFHNRPLLEQAFTRKSY
jgi:dsRNA-specific ribonuclease